LTEWKSAFDASSMADADGDGDTDGADFLAWQRNLGQQLGAARSTVSAVPEPHATTLWLAGVIAALIVQRATAI
jgi:hypothetical protein